ncbi:MAG: phage portal protein [Proteobacteria bacterium]|nr:phage portal protein [Pseudomonadota bacterium]
MKKHISDWWHGKKSLLPHLTHYQFDNTYFCESGRAIWSERDYSSFAEEAYIRNVIAFRAISMVAQSAASVPIILTRCGIAVNQHPILELLKRPNPIYSGRELLEQIYSYRLISGNAYLLALVDAKHQPVELMSLRPDRVHVLAGNSFVPSGYRYTAGNKYIDYLMDEETGRCEVLHIKNFHPLSDWYGLSAVEAGAYSIDQHNQAGSWNQALLQNGARPSGALMIKKGIGPGFMTTEQYKQLRENLEKNFSGAMNAGRPMILEGDLEWKEMSMSPKDMDYISTKHSAARDIALAFGMPPQLLGIPGDNTYSNLAEARLALWEQTILPLVEHTIQAINHWLAPCFNDGIQLSYDLEQVPAMIERREKLWKQLAAADFMTINEKRAAMGLKPILGGNKL